MDQKKIRLEYSPELAIVEIEKMLNARFPEYKIKRNSSGTKVRLTKNIFVCVDVQIKHNAKKGRTVVVVTGKIPPVGIILCFCLVGLIFPMILGGDIVQEVAETLAEEVSIPYKVQES